MPCWRRWLRCCCSWPRSLRPSGYLRTEEIEREQEAVKRDLEYAQQRMRLRLLERQEQLMRMAREISQPGSRRRGVHGPRRDPGQRNTPSCQAVTWIDERRQDHREPRLTPSLAAASPLASPARQLKARRHRGQLHPGARPAATGLLAARRRYGHAAAASMHIPLTRPRPVLRRAAGRVFGRQPAALRRADRGLGQATQWRCSTARTPCWPALDPRAAKRIGLLPWATHVNEYEVPVSPVRQRPDPARPGLPHLAGRDRQRPVLAGLRAERA